MCVNERVVCFPVCVIPCALPVCIYELVCTVCTLQSSGRCWLFAATNLMRVAMMKKFNLPNDFELSQNYLFLFDKLERANYFLGTVLRTLDSALDSRVVQHLLAPPQQDGGQWDMVVNIVTKYGIVPKVRI